MKVRCVVPDCAGVIDSPRPAETPCPECVKRVALVPRLQEQVRALQQQLIQLQAAKLGRVVPVLRAIAKKPLAAAEVAGSLKRPKNTVGSTLIKLERRGLVTVAEYRRVAGKLSGTPLWRLSALGERVLQERVSDNGGGGVITGNAFRCAA